MSNLKKCPFCGGEAKICGYYFIQCTKCGSNTLTHTNIESAINAWNTRIPTVEAKPVVHCKDCEHWGTGVAGETEHVKCCEYGRYMVGENGYCCYADMRGKNMINEKKQMTIHEAIIDIKENIKPVVGGKSLDIALDALEKYVNNDWIPCSKRLPNHSDNNINDSALSIPVLVQYDSEKEPEVLHYNTFTAKFCYDQVDLTNEVVARMPLPGENAKYFYNDCKNKILKVANGFTFTDETQQRQYMEFLEYCLKNAFEESKNE